MSICSVCDGTGKVFGGYSEATQPDSVHQLEEWDTCGNCEGSGHIDAKDSKGRLIGGSTSIGELILDLLRTGIDVLFG